MSKGDSSLGAVSRDNQMNILMDFVSNIYKKQAIEKPQKFTCENVDFITFLKEVEKYHSALSINDDIGKVSVLFECLDQKVKNILIFEKDYEKNYNNYQWICDKLKILFPKKTNVTSSLLDLLNIKQNSLSLREYILKIKNVVVSNIDIPKNMHHKYAVEILLKGLDDRQIASAVKLQNPLTIDEAEKLIKSVIKKDENNFSTSVNRLMNDRNNMNFNQGSEIADLKNEVKLLREIIMSLKSQIGDKFNQSRPRRNLGFSRPNQFKTYQDNRNTNNYNRQSTSWQQVPFSSNKRCYGCGKEGHIQRACPSRRRVNELHFPMSSDIDTTTESVEEPEFPTERQGHEHPQINLIKSQPKNNSKIKSFPRDIELADKYINGQISYKSYSDAVKSCNNTLTVTPEKSSARYSNKPYVRGRVCNKPTPIFLDTGAEVNVISKSLIQTLPNFPKLCHSVNQKIQCANGSNIEVVAETILPVSIGVETCPLKFVVANNLSPSIIVGLRGLKSFKAALLTEKDCVVCKGIEIPFMAGTTCDSANQKNAYWTH